MTPEDYVAERIVLPDLKIQKVQKFSNNTYLYHCIKRTEWEVCRKCPTKSYSVHDHRTVSIRDQKLRNKNIRLIIRKRRFRCPNCKSVFTESIDGIKVGHRTTENYRDQLLYDSKHYENTKDVAWHNRCSDTLVTQVVNEREERVLSRHLSITTRSASEAIDHMTLFYGLRVNLLLVLQMKNFS